MGADPQRVDGAREPARVLNRAMSEPITRRTPAERLLVLLVVVLVAWAVVDVVAGWRDDGVAGATRGLLGAVWPLLAACATAFVLGRRIRVKVQ